MNKTLVSTEVSGKIDIEAQNDWGFNTFSLIESAARNCARVFQNAFPRYFQRRIMRILVLAGSGNNGTDALCMLRNWLLEGFALAETSKVVLIRMPDTTSPGEISPHGSLYISLREMQVPVCEWDDSILRKDNISEYDLIIDGIAGTGARSPLKGTPGEMVEKLNSLMLDNTILKKPMVVSVDLPSGLSDEWKPEMPIVNSNVTLAIQPQKLCLYNPASRFYAGTILTVGGIFPQELINFHKQAELLEWDLIQKSIPPVRSDIHKYHRGTVEIHAGCSGSAGAAAIAARGAQAAGAGLVRLVVDNDIYPIIASQAAGIMVSPAQPESSEKKYQLDAILLGPGWGRGSLRHAQMEAALKQEKTATPLIIDADAIALSKETVFSGNTLLTPHVGEFAALSGAAIEEIESRPLPILLKTAAQKNAVILLKSHVMFIAAPDGRLGVIDGMSPNLAAGGSGDLLAGLCAAIAARLKKQGVPDLYTCAATAACLLVKAAKSKELAQRFIDPMELADKAAELAGGAWLCHALQE